MSIINLKEGKLYQWDTGIEIVVSLPMDTVVKRVDFKSRAIKGLLSMKAIVKNRKYVSEIPNEMLQHADEITAYVVISHSGDEERTIFHRTFKVEPKEKPEGYVCDQQEILRFESLEARIEALEKGSSGSVPGVVPSVTAKPRISEVTLTASGWKGEASPYSQVVQVNGATENSQVDLTPSVEQLAVFYNKDLAFVTENEDGVVTVFAIGQKPQNDYTIQVTITEVDYE